MESNTKTNNLIRNLVIASDFLLLNLLFIVYTQTMPTGTMTGNSLMQLMLIVNMALVMAETMFSTLIHRRRVSIERVVRQVTLLIGSQFVMAFLLVSLLYPLWSLHLPSKVFAFHFVGLMWVASFIVRITEYRSLQCYRRRGGNRRDVVLIGSDSALLDIYEFLVQDPTVGYHVAGYYANHPISGAPQELKHLGTLADLDTLLSFENGLQTKFQECYISLSWQKHDEIDRIMMFCDKKMVHCYFVPVASETFGHQLKVERYGRKVVFTNYNEPLSSAGNKAIKRTFDIVFSLIVLVCLLPFLPFIALAIKLSSPGPILFKQTRTGMNGKDFTCFKFRSMHVNKDADRLQATEHDPRKFAFGNFMRKSNVDELPQFWNVLKGDMSVVGPRPHMLAHTEQYSALIDKYMVRHFVRPGITGWAQVTGFRGETKELWQMEERVKADIWYIENWSIWLDLRIIWKTVKQVFIHDKHAY